MKPNSGRVSGASAVHLGRGDRRRHHPALPAAAERYRPAAQARVITLLDGRIEGVHVNVDDMPN